MRGWSSVVPLVVRLAEIVEEAGEAHLEPVAAVGGELRDREEMLVEGKRLPVGVERKADRGGELRDHLGQHARVAGEHERARRLPPEQELRELALAVGLDSAADPLRRDVSEPRCCRLHLGQRLRRKVEIELGDEAQPPNDAQRIVLEARRPDGAQLAQRQILDAAERIDEGAVLEPAGHRVDREVAAGHVLLELDRGVADDREVPVPRPGRPLRARRHEVDPRRDERPYGPVARVETHAHELAVHLHVLHPAVRLEQRPQPCLVDPGNEEVLVSVGDAEQLVAHRPTDDVGVDAERADVGADLGRHRQDSACPVGGRDRRAGKGRPSAPRPYVCAIASISTRAPAGSFATSKVERAGGRSPTWRA